jgi:hypothetical protein
MAMPEKERAKAIRKRKQERKKLKAARADGPSGEGRA